MESDLRVGTTVYIEHLEQGDIYYKVKIISERQPSSVERCKVCLRGELVLDGHLVQTGFLDDKIYAVTRCKHCCAITVFVYHIPHSDMLLPEQGDCDHAENEANPFEDPA